MHLKVWISYFLTILSIVGGAKLSRFISEFDVLRYDTHHVHQQHKRAIRAPNNHHVHLNFKAFGRNFQLRMQPDKSVFTKNFSFVTSDGNQHPSIADDVHFYKGEIADSPGSFLHGSIRDGVFQGRILSRDEQYSVEPASRYIYNASDDFHSVIYKDKHVDLPKYNAGSCGISEDILRRMREKVRDVEGDPPERTENGGDEQSDAPSPRRPKRQSTGMRQTCALHIITDDFYFRRYKERDFSGCGECENERYEVKIEILRQMGEHVAAASQLFNQHNFDNGFDAIEFGIQQITVYTDKDVGTSDYPFDGEYIGVERYLDIASGTKDHGTFCLVYSFTNRDFANGILGLAWIASPTDPTGGICSRDYNSGIITTNNYGKDVPPVISQLTFAHELGHSFGSRHDSDGDSTCSPGGTRGNYLMFAHASAGDLPNNNEFSTCSMTNISRVLNSLGGRRDSCFEEAGSVTLCGNNVLEGNEVCDCGHADQCEDQCCVGQSENNPLSSCTLKAPGICSPQQGLCCSSTCSYHDRTTMCAQSSECHEASYCDSSSYVCPKPAPANDTIPCDNGRKICDGGECSKSICEKYENRKQCQCTKKEERCQICCAEPSKPNVCVALKDITIMDPVYMDVGSPCEAFMGYCDFFNECRHVLEDGPLIGIVRKFLLGPEIDQTDFLEAVLIWLTSFWWLVVIVFVVLIGVMALIMFLCNLTIPTDNPWKEEMHNAKRNRVSLRTRRERGSQYPRGNPPPSNAISAF